MNELHLGGGFVLTTDTLTRPERRAARRRPDLRGRGLRVFTLVRAAGGGEEFVVIQPGGRARLWAGEARRAPAHWKPVN